MPRLLSRVTRGVLALALTLAACGRDSTAPAPDTAVASISIIPVGYSLRPGQGVQLTANAVNAEGTALNDVRFQWTSSDESRVRVDSTGVVTGVARGVATVTARAGGVSAETTIRVDLRPEELPTSGVAISDSALWIRRGNTSPLSASPYVTQVQGTTAAVQRAVTWSVADSSVLTIVPGSVTATASNVTLATKKTGTTYVIATTEGFRDSTRVTVLGPPASIIPSTSAATLYLADTLFLSATVVDSAGQRYPDPVAPSVAWSSSAPGVASVAEQARLSVVVRTGAVGTATVTGRVNELSATVQLTIRPGVATVQVTPGSSTLAAGASVPFTAVARDSSGNVVPGRTFSWRSSDLSLLAVSAAGVATGRAGGAARVFATANGKTGSASVTVTGPPPAAASTWREISAGATHSCGIDTAARLLCWGANDQGQLGDGTRNTGSVPRLVSGGRTYTHVSVGSSRSCATATGGDTYCWGAMYEAASDVPAKVNASSPLTGLSMGNFFACALTAAGAPVCWGSGTRTTSRDPQAVPVTGSFLSVTGSNEGGCGLRSSGAVTCWVGLGFSSYSVASGGVETLDGAVNSSASGFVCGRASGVVSCTHSVASGGAGGQFLNGDFHALTGSPSGVKQVSAGGSQVCALDQAGATYCWTRRQSGNLGTTATFQFDQPARVAEGFAFAQISVGEKHACGITTGGQGYCWGSNASGQLGVGTTGGESDGPSPIAKP